MLILQRSTFYK